MNNAIQTIGRHYIAVLSESLVFIAYFAAFMFLATVRTPLSNWALAPHLLINATLFIVYMKHRYEGRPSMYWSHFDLLVVLLFIYFVATVHYSEIRVISWRMVPNYIDGLSGYFIGRLLFYHRLRTYVGFLLFAAVTVYVLAGFAQLDLARETDADPLLKSRLLQTQRVVLLCGGFWLLSFPFLFFRKPGRTIFLLYTALILLVYSLLVAKRLAWLVELGHTQGLMQVRYEKYQTLQTAWRIVRNYPLVGCGTGTFPVLFEAYRESPAIEFVSTFNAYLYSVVEIGLIGTIIILYFLVRFPLHVIRRWRLFPNRRLRLAVFIFVAFEVLVFLQGFYDADIFSPVAWFIIWTNMGIFMSLVMIRDPVRIFETPFYRPDMQELEYEDDAIRRPHTDSVFRPRFLGLPASGSKALFSIVFRHLLPALLGLLFALGLTVAEAAPYAASKIARRRSDEQVASESYGKRLERAVRIFSYDGQLWKKLGSHYQEQVESPLDLFNHKSQIEYAFNEARRHNPYDPNSYERLFNLYRDTKDMRSAQQILREGVANNPNDFYLRMLLVKELERDGKLVEAIYHTKQALFRISPESKELYLTLAENYYARGMIPQARLYYDYARQVVPDDVQNSTRLRRLRERLEKRG